ncbi:hypothetical protein ACFP8W_15160 [Nocardioides hankookensis]|uniref:Uncharacterized protein n=1 Tax=Nocardioides hankookensis TaxID=443157 RepID=A0ABW1LQE4_9ACTN
MTALLIVALLGCDDSDQVDALTGPASEREICVPADGGPSYVVGVATAQNTGDAPVTITSVELDGAKGLDLVDTSVVTLGPDRPVGEFGVWTGDPPDFGPDDADVEALWEDRTPAIGATIEPGDGADTNFIVQLHGADGASSGPLRVEYEDGDSGAGSWTSNVTYRVSSTC